MLSQTAFYFHEVIIPSLPLFFFFQAEDGIRDTSVTGVQTCALPISRRLPVLRDLGLVGTTRGVIRLACEILPARDRPYPPDGRTPACFFCSTFFSQAPCSASLQ